LIHISAASRFKVNPIQKAVPKNTCGGSPEKTKNSATIGRMVPIASPMEKALIIHSRCSVTCLWMIFSASGLT